MTITVIMISDRPNSIPAEPNNVRPKRPNRFGKCGKFLLKVLFCEPSVRFGFCRTCSGFGRLLVFTHENKSSKVTVCHAVTCQNNIICHVLMLILGSSTFVFMSMSCLMFIYIGENGNTAPASLKPVRGLFLELVQAKN